jgi:D-3-phosphoglycerate dehydrogenase
MSLCVITDYQGDDTLLEEHLLGEAGVEVFISPSYRVADWVQAAEQADAILTRHAPIDATVLERLQRCRVIARYGIGFDNIDVAAATRRGIAVTYVPGYCTEEVADHAVAMILMASRALGPVAESMRHGAWTPHPMAVVERLRGRTLGLLACGAIGRAVAARAQAFGLAVIAYDPYAPQLPEGVERVGSLEELLPRSQILSLHAPLTPETARFMDARRIAMLPPGAILVNVARGPLVDLEAATQALASGRLGWLALDVFDPEPLPADHPLRKLPNAILTPHLAFYSRASLEEGKRRAVGNVLAVLAGRSPVDPVPVGAPG